MLGGQRAPFSKEKRRMQAIEFGAPPCHSCHPRQSGGSDKRKKIEYVCYIDWEVAKTLGTTLYKKKSTIHFVHNSSLYITLSYTHILFVFIFTTRYLTETLTKHTSSQIMIVLHL
ncbi:uncharacterized protein VTP21DRAFT_2287 [Calcarisporiella thermophila]|uniref:uncharacterized protein n=1 Tax=Calcarisporiella thermophila TaxID=911321 RepID=UPI0037444C17